MATASSNLRAVPLTEEGVNARFARWRRLVDRHLAQRLGAARGVPPRLAAALRYAVLGGGKRLRPQFLLLGCDVAGEPPERAVPAAAAFELVHAFSLVHDDLPAMDDDDLRRGRPTLHRRFDEATAILAGDALLALAFEEIATLPARGVAAARALEAGRLLAQAAGANGMVAGQYLDMQAEGRGSRTGVRTVHTIHARKTGALFAAALESGGVLGGAGAPVRGRLRRIGLELGLAFQIVDDLLDERSSERVLGKRVRSDRARGKATYPAVAGVEGAERAVARHVGAARRSAQPFTRHRRHFEYLARCIAEREA